MASGQCEAVSKGGQNSQTNSGHYSNLFVGRRPVSVLGLVCSPGRWTAINRNGNLRHENEVTVSFTPCFKGKLFLNL